MQDMARGSSLVGTAALVTGGGSGIGSACARRLASDGVAVTICGRTESRLAAAVESLGAGCRHVVADITQEADVERAVSAATEATGGLDIVVANAGGATAIGPLALIDVSAFENEMRLNVTGTFLTIKHSAPQLAGSKVGSIVAVSSIAGCLTHRLLGPYSISKSAIEMLVLNAADELGRFGVRVNAVRPGLVPTDASDPLASDPTTRADYLAQMPLGRLGAVEDIAAAVRFLAGPESSWITGQCLGVDGGHSLRRGPDLDALIGVHFESLLADRMAGTSGQKTV